MGNYLKMNQPPLTRKKRQWAKNRDVTLRGKRLNYNAAIQGRYVRALKNLVTEMTRQTNQQVIALFKGKTGKQFFAEQKEITAMDASLSSQARILLNKLSKKFEKLFNFKSIMLAEWMTEQTAKVSKTSLHGSLEQLTGGLSLKTGIVTEGTEEVSKAIIAENVSLIKSIPEQYFNDVTGSVMRSITTGQGLADLIPDLKKYEGQTERRAKNLALDQTRKAYNSINKQRLVSLNVKQFEWIHSGGGQKPRKSHLMLDGKTFSFENLRQEQIKLGVPESDLGIPGEAINCRCTILPIIQFED